MSKNREKIPEHAHHEHTNLLLKREHRMCDMANQSETRKFDDNEALEAKVILTIDCSMRVNMLMGSNVIRIEIATLSLALHTRETQY